MRTVWKEYWISWS